MIYFENLIFDTVKEKIKPEQKNLEDNIKILYFYQSNNNVRYIKKKYLICVLKKLIIRFIPNEENISKILDENLSNFLKSADLWDECPEINVEDKKFLDELDEFKKLNVKLGNVLDLYEKLDCE